MIVDFGGAILFKMPHAYPLLRKAHTIVGAFNIRLLHVVWKGLVESSRPSAWRKQGTDLKNVLGFHEPMAPHPRTADPGYNGNQLRDIIIGILSIMIGAVQAIVDIMSDNYKNFQSYTPSTSPGSPCPYRHYCYRYIFILVSPDSGYTSRSWRDRQKRDICNVGKAWSHV